MKNRSNLTEEAMINISSLPQKEINTLYKYNEVIETNSKKDDTNYYANQILDLLDSSNFHLDEPVPVKLKKMVQQ